MWAPKSIVDPTYYACCVYWVSQPYRTMGWAPNEKALNTMLTGKLDKP